MCLCVCVEKMVNSLQHQPPAQLATEPTVNHVTPAPANDPVVRKQAVQDLMAQMQGTYNFMQVKRSSSVLLPLTDGDLMCCSHIKIPNSFMQ